MRIDAGTVLYQDNIGLCGSDVIFDSKVAETHSNLPLMRDDRYALCVYNIYHIY